MQPTIGPGGDCRSSRAVTPLYPETFPIIPRAVEVSDAVPGAADQLEEIFRSGAAGLGCAARWTISRAVADSMR